MGRMDEIHLQKDIRSAIKKGDVEKLSELLGSSTERLNIQTPFGTWLHVAASKGQLEIAKKLLQLGIDINALGSAYGGGALNNAASVGNIEMVEYLIAQGAEMDVTSPTRNPLFGAISNGSFDIAKILIEAGIDTKVKYGSGSTGEIDALSFAKEQGQTEIVNMLQNQKMKSDPVINHRSEEENEVLKRTEACFGPIKNTISEIIPASRVSINIHDIPPTKNKNFRTLVTSGMSDKPMGYSNEEKAYKFAELLLKLPATWRITKEDVKEQEQQWPIQWLRKTANIPHIYDGWIEEGTILPNGEPPQPFALNTDFSSIMLISPKEEELKTILTKSGEVKMYTLVPLYEEERQLAILKGYPYLLEKMRDRKISDVIDVNRINVAKK